MLSTVIIYVAVIKFSPAFAISDIVYSNKTSDDYVPCERGWYYFRDNCYRGEGGKGKGLIWPSALAKCREYGADLVSIHSQEEQGFIIAFLILENEYISWIGLNDREKESDYRWSDGSAFDYTNWQASEPSGLNNEKEDCVYMYLEPMGTWNDINCEYTTCDYICEMKANPAERSPDIKYCSRREGGGLKFKNSCYHLVTEMQTWSNAERYCKSNYNGHLLTVQDKFQDYFIEYVLSDIKTEIWIGIKIQEQKWTSGSDVTNEKFNKGEKYKEGTCIARKNRKEWITIPCSRRLPFICEVSKVNGNWGEWSEWSKCSASCNEGRRKRYRACDNPAPARGGDDCFGLPRQTESCGMELCPMNGNWGEWSDWSKCSASCNEGQRKRFRACDNPTPAGGGSDCLGLPRQTESCAMGPCPNVLYCESLETFSNGQVMHQPVGQTVSTRTTPDDDTLYREGSRLHYTCNRGYTLVGATTLICEKSGLWSGEQPVCTRNRSRSVSCRHPGTVGNAQVVHIPPLHARQRPTDQPWEEYPAGSQLQYTCGYGYTLAGPFVLHCQNNGKWTAKPPVCITKERTESMPCENPGLILNGRAQYFPPAINQRTDSKTDEYPEQAVLEYSCDEGYRLQGRRSLTCQSTGLWSGDIPSCVPDCGRSLMQTHNRVINGSKTISGDWPWVVSISVDDNDRAPFICGGAVINTHTVVTAAHCLAHPSVLNKTLILRFGKHYFGVQGDDNEVLVRRSSRVIVHPDYSNTNYDSDIGLVFFKQRIRYSIRVQPICLPTRESTSLNIEPGRAGYVGGWGVTETEGFPSEMMLASLPVVSNRQCMDAYKQQNLVITSNMFCAGYEDARQSVCGGDSGSPFVFYDRRIKRYILEGLVSFTVKGQCGVAGQYAIFTKVFRFLDWIIKLYNNKS